MTLDQLTEMECTHTCECCKEEFRADIPTKDIYDEIICPECIKLHTCYECGDIDPKSAYLNGRNYCSVCNGINQ